MHEEKRKTNYPYWETNLGDKPVLIRSLKHLRECLEASGLRPNRELKEDHPFTWGHKEYNPSPRIFPRPQKKPPLKVFPKEDLLPAPEGEELRRFYRGYHYRVGPNVDPTNDGRAAKYSEWQLRWMRSTPAPVIPDELADWCEFLCSNPLFFRRRRNR